MNRSLGSNRLVPTQRPLVAERPSSSNSFTPGCLSQLLQPPELLEQQSMLILLLPGEHVLQGVLCLDSSRGCIKSDAKLEDELSVRVGVGVGGGDTEGGGGGGGARGDTRGRGGGGVGGGRGDTGGGRGGE